MKKLFNNLGNRYVWLMIGLSLLCIGLFRSCLVRTLPSSVCDVWLKDLTINILSESFVILVVFLGFNRAVRINKENEKKKFKELAFRQLKIGLYGQIVLLFNMLKASVATKPDKSYEKIEDLFDEIYFSELEFLNLLKIAPVLTVRGEEMDWIDYLDSEFSTLRRALPKVVNRYFFYLDSQEVEVMEQLANAGFIRFIKSIKKAKQLQGKNPLRGDLLSECQTLIEEYINSLLKLINLYNQNVESDKQIKIESEQWNEWWSEKVRPQIGESRIEIAEEEEAIAPTV